jgi:MFS family permease
VRFSTAPAIDLLRRERDLRFLFGARLASELGTWLALVALNVTVFDLTRSATWVSAVVAANFVPSIVVGILLAPLVDRVSRKAIMVASDIASAGAFAALVFLHSPAAIVVAAAAAGAAGALFRPALLASVPNVVGERDLAQANALLQATMHAAALLGPLLAAGVLAAAGAGAAFALNAVSFVASAVCVLRVAATERGERKAPATGRARRDGVAVLRRTPVLGLIIATWALAAVALAAVNVAEVVLAREALHGGDLGYPLLVASSGLGLLLGSGASAALTRRRSPRQLYGVALAATAAGLAGAAVAPDVVVAMPCVLVSGAGNGVALVCVSLVIQTSVADELRGRVYAILGSALQLAFALGTIASGKLTDLVGPRLVWLGAAATLAAAAFAACASRERCGVHVAARDSSPRS